MTVVLGIDTATPQVSVALRSGDEPLAIMAVSGGRRHGELLAPAIASICDLAATPLATVDVVAVDVGPGLFTGLRVGVATARALVSALGRCGIGLTSLEVLAAAHPRERCAVVAVVDARRSEVFWARFRPTPTGPEPIGPAAVARPDQVAGELAAAGEEALVVGDGARRYASTFAAVAGAEVAGPDDAYPSAAVAARLAGERLAAGVALGSMEPVYLRSPDVRVGWASRPQTPPPEAERG